MDVHHKYHQYIHEYHQSSSISSIFININQPMDILFHWCTKKYGICWVWLSSMEKMPQPNPANSPLAWSRRVHHNIWRQGKLLGATTPLIHPGYPWLTYHCTGKSSVCRSYSEAKDFRPPPPELWFWDFTDFTDSGRRCKRSITFLGTSQGGVTNFLGKYPQIHSENFRWNWSLTSHKKLFWGLTWGTPVTCLAIFSSAEPSSRRWSSCTRSSTSRGTSAAKREKGMVEMGEQKAITNSSHSWSIPMGCWFGIWTFWPGHTNQRIQHIESQEVPEVAKSTLSGFEGRALAEKHPRLISGGSAQQLTPTFKDKKTGKRCKKSPSTNKSFWWHSRHSRYQISWGKDDSKGGHLWHLLLRINLNVKHQGVEHLEKWAQRWSHTSYRSYWQ